MSYIVIQYKNNISDIDFKNLLKTEFFLIELTANLLSKKKSEIIVEYKKFETYNGEKDILVRAETSVRNIKLLSKWATEVKKIFISLNKKVGIKTYVVDSAWEEIN